MGASRCTIALGCKRALLTPHAEQAEWQIVTHLLESVDHTAWPAQGPVEPWPTWRAHSDAEEPESSIWKKELDELGMIDYNKEAIGVNRRMAALAATAAPGAKQEWTNMANTVLRDSTPNEPGDHDAGAYNEEMLATLVGMAQESKPRVPRTISEWVTLEAERGDETDRHQPASA